ncbi:hypothetical protein KKB44_03050 [Candidatus Micrarchaeota archaeon]|nr:hypothetical protein [Candidatus Micrarchaeota archaeon]
MEYIKISKQEYEELLKCRDIINYLEEEVHERLGVRPLEDKKAIKVLKELHEEAKKGKRKTIGDEEFTGKYQHLL